ncbi:MAG: flagellar filament capping protein FliD [Phycisphaerales bacterium]|nr:flagellar filament capping protein FliD [Phycisphaerales bacterium]
MGTISSGVGLFSGIDSKSIIDQLIAVESRPKQLIQQRVLQLQTQTAAILDLNTRLSGLRTAVEKFRTANPFDANAAKSSDDTLLSATASTSAAAGSYSFLIDRLVSSQQVLSRGFADKSASAVGAGSVKIISAKARLDGDTALADLNDGAGVTRGKIVLTDSAGNSTTVDLSKAAYMNDVLDAINNNGVAKVSAKVVDDKLVLTDSAGGGGQVRVAESGSATAASLGILGQASGTLTGTSLRNLTSNTLLASLNDGRGVARSESAGTARFDLTIAVNRGGTTTNVRVNLGEVSSTTTNGGVTTTTVTEGPVATVGAALKRINDAFASAGLSGISAAIASDGKSLRVTDGSNGIITVTENGSGTAAKDLGLLGSATGTLNGKRIASGINTALGSSINGGKGIAGDGNLDFILGDLNSFSVTIDKNATLTQIAKQIEDASVSAGNKRVSVSLTSNGMGLVVKDLVGGGGGLTIGGTSGNDTAASLGISGFSSSGSITASDLKKATIGTGTLLANLVTGKSFAAGKMKITDSTGIVTEVSYDPAVQKSVGDLLYQINSQLTSKSSTAVASINDTGDGILIKDTAAPAVGLAKIQVSDVTGTLAKELGIAGTATGLTTDNKLDGTSRKTITLSATDTLQGLVDKVNGSGGSVKAAIVQTGSGVTPYQLSLFSTATGRDGRFVIDSGSLDLGLRTIDAGENAKVFYGSSDAASAVLLTSTTNTLDSVVTGVKIDLKGASSKQVTVSVSRDNDALTAALSDVAKNFNNVIDRIASQTSYDADSKRSGPLLGDATALALRSQLFSVFQARPQGVSGKYQSLSQVGFKIGTGGRIEFDADKFRAALADDPDGVEALVSARVVDPTSGSDQQVGNLDGVKVKDTSGKLKFTQLGLMGKIEEFAKTMLDSVDGALTRRKKTLDDQISSQNSRITTIDTQLANRRTVLEAQFRRMETAIGQLQTQSSSLSSIGR